MSNQGFYLVGKEKIYKKSLTQLVLGFANISKSLPDQFLRYNLILTLTYFYLKIGQVLVIFIFSKSEFSFGYGFTLKYEFLAF